MKVNVLYFHYTPYYDLCYILGHCDFYINTFPMLVPFQCDNLYLCVTKSVKIVKHAVLMIALV